MAVLPSCRAVLVVAYVGGGYQVSAPTQRGTPLLLPSGCEDMRCARVCHA